MVRSRQVYVCLLYAYSLELLIMKKIHKALEYVELYTYLEQKRVGDLLKWYTVLKKVSGRVMGVHTLYNYNILPSGGFAIGGVDYYPIKESEFMAYVIELSDGKRIYSAI